MTYKTTAGKGEMLFAELDNVILPLQTNLSLQYTVKMDDPETKDDNAYQEPDEDGDRWTLQVDAQVPADWTGIDVLESAYNNGDEISANVGIPDDWEEGQGVPVSGDWGQLGEYVFQGTGCITSLSLTAAVNNKATLSVTISGTNQGSF